MLGIELTPEHPVAEVADRAARAEAAGFDTVFASHHYNNRDEFVALAAIAEATGSVRLGPGITNPYETHPVALASRMATLEEFAGGRGVFGVGAGDRSTLANLGYEGNRPLRRVLETMQVARRLWAGEAVDHDGTFQADGAALNYEAGSIPVYIGAQGPHMTRMAAKYADGVLFNGAHPRDVAWASERVAEGLAERPDERGEFDFAVYASVSAAEDREAAREAARPPVGEAISAGEFPTAFERVTPAMLEAFCIAGTPGTVEGRVADILTEADSVVAASPLGPDAAAIDLAGGALRRASE
jgi:5,10-methylenetetrahydromethanopterin reductase